MSLSRISNTLARSFLVFIIAWLWTSFYVRGFFLIALISVSIVILFEVAVSFIGKHRTRSHTLKSQERTHMHQVTLQLKFMTKPQVQALFRKAVPSAKVHSLFHTTPTEQDIIKCVKMVSKPKFPSKISPSGLATSSNEGCPENRGGVFEKSKIILTAESFTPQVTAFARSLDANIILLDAEAVYTQILKPTQTFPPITIQTKRKTPRKTLAEIKSMIFNRTRTKSYVITGAVILFSSLIVRLHIYYIIIATIVFGLALTSYYSPKVPKNLFDT